MPDLTWDKTRIANGTGFAVGIALFIVFYGPFLVVPGAFGIVDHDYFLSWQLAVNDALRSGEVLHWFHHMCGGVPGLANPQSGALSPLNFLGLMSGPVAQFKIELVIHGLLCLIGFFYFCHLKKIPGWYGLFGFMIWIGNGFVATRVLHGQTTYYPLLLLPIFVALLYATDTGDQEKGWKISKPSPGVLIMGTLLFVFVLYQDGFHVFIYNYLFLGLLALGIAVHRRDGAPALALIIWTVIGVGLALPRLLPVFELLQHFPRQVPDKEFIGFIDAIRAFINPDLKGIYTNAFIARVDMHRLGYMAYVGAVPLLLSAYFFIFARDPDKYVWLIAMLLSFTLMLGHLSAWSPWALMHTLPVFDQIRAPFKFVSFLLLSLAFLAIIASHHMIARIQQHLTRHRKPAWLASGLAGILLALLVFDLSRAHQPLFLWGFSDHQPSFETIDHTQPFESLNLRPGVMFSGVANNLGMLNCYDPIQLNNSASVDTPLARIVSGSGRVEARLLPNRIVITSVITSKDARILINQNDHPDWFVERGIGALVRDTDLQAHGGLLQLSIPAGEAVTHLSFKPETFAYAVIFSLFFSGCLLFSAINLYLWRRLRRRLRRRIKAQAV